MSTFLHDLDHGRLPRHVGIVMDGNGRWAKQRGLPRTEGHAAGETMLEAVDKVAEEHERNVRLFMLLLTGLRALDAGPKDAAAVTESFLLKMLSLSGFHPSLTGCAICGRPSPERFASGQGGAVCCSGSPSTTSSGG